jgi:cold shock protein
MTTPEVLTGTVKWFNAEKGYGFITIADRGDIFVPLRGLAEGRTTLSAGEPVYFNVRQAPKGLEAANVRVGAPPAPPKPAPPSMALSDPAQPATVKLRVVGRPTAAQPLGRPGQSPSVVAFTLEAGEEQAAALPKGLPPVRDVTTFLVLVSIKHWRQVTTALDADPDDPLVVDGYGSIDPLAPGMITLRATSLATEALLRSRWPAQAAARAEPETPDDAAPDGDEKQEEVEGMLPPIHPPPEEKREEAERATPLTLPPDDGEGKRE